MTPDLSRWNGYGGGAGGTARVIVVNLVEIAIVTLVGMVIGWSIIEAQTRVDRTPLLQMGTGTATYQPAGALTVSTTSVGNVGAGEDNLITYSLPAATLTANGKAVRIRAWGTSAANANNKTVKLYFGAQLLATLAAAASNDRDWLLEAVVVRTGAATQEAIAWGTRAATDDPQNAIDRTTPAETLSGAVTIKATGEATSDNDLVQRGLLVEALN